MAVNLSPVGGVAAQFFTNNGTPLTGGKLYTYSAGSTTPAATFTSSNGSTAWTNPIVLDAAGRVPGSGEIWLTDGVIYKFILKDSNDVLIATYDNITGINSNSVAFVNQQEIVTATAGQTVFNLGINYQPATNSLSVFVDGVNQYGPGALYAYTETDSNTVTFTSGLHVGAEVKFTTTQQQSAGSVDASQVTYEPPFTGFVATNVEAKLAQYVSVIDFGADPTGVADSTAAIQAAQQASKYVYCPPGTYKVTGLRIYDQVNLIGAGYENTVFVQADPAQPAINCLSDATVGQLLSLRLENFGVVGHASATVAAVKIEALGVFAIYRSHFDMIISQCYQGLNMQASAANNVFYCTFRMDVVGTQTTSVVLNGGVYNTYDFFIAQVGNGRMIDHGGFNNTFIRLVGEGQIVCSGQNIIYFSPTIEELPNAPPSATGIVLNGFNQTLITPTLILNPTNSLKIDYCIKPFASSLVVNPRFIVNGTLHPFESIDQNWTLQGPGQNGCVNKMEVIYDGSDDSKDLRRVDKVGNVSSFMSSSSGTFGGKSVQYLAPAAGASINYRILNSTDAMIFNPAGTVALINVNLGYASSVRRNGQTLSVYTKEAITSLNWTGNGSDATLFPASMTAGQTVRFVYDEATTKWWPC